MAVTFYECLMTCAGNDDLVREYSHLRCHNLGRDLRTPLEKLIDANTGYEAIIQQHLDDETVGFVRFAFEIWQRMPAEERV